MPPSSARTDAATPAIITSTPEAPAHTLLEDGAAIATGVLLVALGVAFFKQAGLLTGGITGLAFVLHYSTHTSLGLWLFVLNLPFYWLAVLADMGVSLLVVANGLRLRRWTGQKA